MTARFLVGDVFERMAELPDHSFDLIVTSPPFLAPINEAASAVTTTASGSPCVQST